MNQPIPRIIRELLSKRGELESRMRKMVEDAGFRMLGFDIQHRDSSFALGCQLVLLRGTPSVVCFAFSQAKNPCFTGVIQNTASGTRFEYHRCTYEQVSEAVLRELGTHIIGCKNEITALEYFGFLARRFDAIRAYRLSTLEEDNDGIDIVVSVRSGSDDQIIDVPIQVKSGPSTQAKHRQKENRRHIPSIVISKRKTYQGLVDSMKSLLTQYVTSRRVLHI